MVLGFMMLLLNQ